MSGYRAGTIVGVFVIQVYLTVLLQNNINLSGLANEEVHIITIHHLFKEIIIRSKSKSINGHLLFLLDEALSLKFNYDKIFQIEEDANDFFFQNSSDIEKIIF